MIGAFRLGAIAAAVRIATGGGGGDPAIDNLVLLAHFDGADNATTFVDSGPNAITLSASGTIALQAEQSKFGGTSLGALAAGHVQGTHAAIAFGLGDFTVEGWAYGVTVSTAAQRGPFQLCTSAAGPEGSITTIAAFVSGSGTWGFYIGDTTVTTGSPVDAATWYHLAVSRAAGTLRIFVNGALVYEAAHAHSFTGTGFAIGVYYGTGFRWDGYVDEFRVLSAGIYTEAFTPPTAPFPDE